MIREMILDQYDLIDIYEKEYIPSFPNVCSMRLLKLIVDTAQKYLYTYI